MNRDDIIRMALEVGFAQYGEDAGEYRIPTPAFHGRLERFAALVAAEKEAQMIRDGYRKCAEKQRTTQFCGLLDAAVKAEREACAKICDETRYTGYVPAEDGEARAYYDAAAESCAKEIRARGEP